MNYRLIFMSFFAPLLLKAQDNCKVYLAKNDSIHWKACTALQASFAIYQFRNEFIEICDAINFFCPDYAPAYREKSVAYIKSADPVNWKKLEDKAVLYDPENYLGIRAGLRAKFFADYQGAIDDLNELEKITTFDLGYTHNGDYHLNILKAICYSQLGEKEKAIEIFEKQLSNPKHLVGLYDYYQLGVTYYETKNYNRSIEIFNKQLVENENAETHYYLG